MRAKDITTREVVARATGSVCCAGRMPCNSSALVARLLNANGIVLGKTRMHELAMGATTINPNGGPVLNPHNNLMHVGGENAPATSPLETPCMMSVFSALVLLTRWIPARSLDIADMLWGRHAPSPQGRG